MTQTVTFPGWVDTGTGRRARQDVDVEVQQGVLVGPGGAGEATVVVNNTGVDMARDALVYVTGVTGGVSEVALADANVDSAAALFYLPNALLAGATGLAYTSGLSVATLNTNAGTVDDPVYLSETAGGWTLTAPTAADSIIQIVGRIAVKSATLGQIMWTVRQGGYDIGTNELQAKCVTAPIIADNAVIGRTIPAVALGYNTVAAVAVDHAAGSPLEILAADATHERLALVTVVATEAAAGGPDIDIGTTNVINSVVDDFMAGAWIIGDRASRLIRIPAAENVRATITAAGTAGALDVYVQVLTPVIQSTNFAAALLTWLNGIRSYIADGMATIATLLVSGAPTTSFQTTTTTIFRRAGLHYSKVAEDPIAFSAADTINVTPNGGSWWGIWLIQTTDPGVVSTVSPAADQNYADEAAAIAALPAVTALNTQLGYLTVQCNAGVAWTANTSNIAVGAGAANAAAFNFYDLPVTAAPPAVLT